MPNIGGPDKGFGIRGDGSPPAGSRDRATVGGLVPPKKRSFSVYSGPKILCFVTQSVL